MRLLRSMKDQEDILSVGQLLMNWSLVVVRKWKLDFDFTNEILKCYRLLVQLQRLHVTCWSTDSLIRICSAIGIPKMVDECTSSQQTLQFTSLLVEVDITVSLVEEVHIEIEGGQMLK